LEFREVERSDGLKRKRSENKGGTQKKKKGRARASWIVVVLSIRLL
jgi:hypothetical protein